MNDHEFVVSLAMDAFRLVIGIKPRNHEAREVIRWIRTMQERRQ
jgi:hypothetical protein